MIGGLALRLALAGPGAAGDLGCVTSQNADMVSVVDSLVAPLSVINALVVALCLKCPEQVRKNLETLEETWNNYQVYLNDEIDFIDDEPMLDYSLRRKEQ